jgi:hypothetical protein
MDCQGVLRETVHDFDYDLWNDLTSESFACVCDFSKEKGVMEVVCNAMDNG